jgi:hypothetical protein
MHGAMGNTKLMLVAFISFSVSVRRRFGGGEKNLKESW